MLGVGTTALHIYAYVAEVRRGGYRDVLRPLLLTAFFAKHVIVLIVRMLCYKKC